MPCVQCRSALPWPAILHSWSVAAAQHGCSAHRRQGPQVKEPAAGSNHVIQVIPGGNSAAGLAEPPWAAAALGAAAAGVPCAAHAAGGKRLREAADRGLRWAPPRAGGLHGRGLPEDGVNAH